MDRPGFIRKVYGILSVQLTFTALFSGFCMHMRASGADGFVAFMLNPALLLIVIIAEIATICALACCGFDRKFPTNYALLSVFTICVSWIVGIICMMAKSPAIVFEAAGLTAAMVICLTFYAITTRTDFTMCGGVIWVLAMLMSVACLMMWIMGPAMHLAYAFLGVFIYSFFLIYDTQLIVGGKHRKMKFDKDAYILASIALYLDIINMFLFVLQILNGERPN